MNSSRGILLALTCVSVTASAASPDAGARRPDVSIANWEAPAKWTPPPDRDGAEQDAKAAPIPGLSAARQPLIVASPTPLTFTPITPCRVADTRGNGFTGSYGPPSIAGGGSRVFLVTGQCGIPSGALAVSFNFVVWNTSSYGDFKIYPTGGAVAPVSTLNWSPSTLALANAAVIPLGTGGNAGQITVVNEGTGPVDLFFDVNGYYGPTGNLPSGTATGSYTKTAAADYFYPTSIYMPSGGACLVLATAQFGFATQAPPTSEGPYFRIAIKRGAAADTNDGSHGNYFQGGGGSWESIDMTRHAVLAINPAESTQVGCFLSAVGDTAWQVGLWCRVSYLCY